MKHEEFRERVWTTEDDREIKIRDLTDKHLANIINHCKKCNDKRPNSYPRWLTAGLRSEAKARSLSKEFIANAPYPWRDDRALELLRKDRPAIVFIMLKERTYVADFNNNSMNQPLVIQSGHNLPEL